MNQTNMFNFLFNKYTRYKFCYACNNCARTEINNTYHYIPPSLCPKCGSLHSYQKYILRTTISFFLIFPYKIEFSLKE